MAAALAPQGVLCICSDNLWYAQMLCRIIGSSRECATNFVSLQQADTKLKVQKEVEGITLFLGVPGQNCGCQMRLARQATLTGCSSRGCQTMRQPSRGTHCVCGGFEISERIGDYCAINNTSRRQGMRSGTCTTVIHWCNSYINMSINAYSYSSIQYLKVATEVPICKSSRARESYCRQCPKP